MRKLEIRQNETTGNMNFREFYCEITDKILVVTSYFSFSLPETSYSSLFTPPGSLPLYLIWIYFIYLFCGVDSRVQRGDETKAHSFSGPVVLVFEASQHSVPHVLQRQHTQKQHAHVLYMFIYGLVQ